MSEADLRDVNLMNAHLYDTRLPQWISGQLEGVKLEGAEGWVPADKNMRAAKLKDADLSGSDLSGVDLSHADLRDTILVKTKLQGADLPRWNSGFLEGVNLAGAI
jgi:uncharacterized protein YjbI with pentapeptide repeats